MPIVRCKICSTAFYAKPFWLKRGYGKYCSAKCQHEASRNGKTVSCFICQKKVYKSLKALVHSKSGKYFCTKSCQTVWRNSIVYVGKNHPNWKDGSHTYRNVILRSKIAQICKRCRTRDKRILAVHHIDRDHQNNRTSNLLWLCHNCHFLIHNDVSEEKRFMETLV